MIDFDRKEALRYLGYRDVQPDAAVEERIARCAADLQAAAQPKSVFASFPLSYPEEDALAFAGVVIHSRNLLRNLKGCRRVYLMAATLGIGPDRLIARASAVRMSDAVIYQAVAAAMIESYCDEVNESIRYEAGRDFRIEHQHDLCRLLDTSRRIGLTVTESCLLAPVKSVTAVIGLSDTPQPCHRRGCEECKKTDCAFRR